MDGLDSPEEASQHGVVQGAGSLDAVGLEQEGHHQHAQHLQHMHPSLSVLEAVLQVHAHAERPWQLMLVNKAAEGILHVAQMAFRA